MNVRNEPLKEAPGTRRAARIAFSTMADELRHRFPDAEWVQARMSLQAVTAWNALPEPGPRQPFGRLTGLS